MVCRVSIFSVSWNRPPQEKLTSHRQVLYLEHSVESLARGGPWLLGKVGRGKSTWRALGEAETEKYGGSSRRRLYGCVFTMFPGRTRRAASGGGTVGTRPLEETFEQQLLTWSQASLPTSFPSHPPPVLAPQPLPTLLLAVGLDSSSNLESGWPSRVSVRIWQRRDFSRVFGLQVPIPTSVLSNSAQGLGSSDRLDVNRASFCLSTCHALS